jgi:hypothetical protein
LGVLALGHNEFDRMIGHAGFVVDKVALGQCCLQALQVSPVTVIPPMLRMHLLIRHIRQTISQIHCVIRQIKSETRFIFEGEIRSRRFAKNAAVA